MTHFSSLKRLGDTDADNRRADEIEQLLGGLFEFEPTPLTDKTLRVFELSDHQVQALRRHDIPIERLHQTEGA